jgi:surfeit locus 1 family protein
VEGTYDSARQVLLDNMPSSRAAAGFSQPGYRVLTPLLIATKQAVLVDRGWLPLGSSRAVLPKLDVSSATRTVRGRLAELPRPGIRLQPSVSQATWPRVLNFPTHAQLESLYGIELLPRIVLLDPQEPDGFKRDWTERYSVAEMGPANHVGYAVQWFGMALVLVIIYVVLALRAPVNDENVQ